VHFPVIPNLSRALRRRRLFHLQNDQSYPLVSIGPIRPVRIGALVQLLS
jgi:hypothetical protein